MIRHGRYPDYYPFRPGTIEKGEQRKLENDVAELVRLLRNCRDLYPQPWVPMPGEPSMYDPHFQSEDEDGNLLPFNDDPVFEDGATSVMADHAAEHVDMVGDATSDYMRMLQQRLARDEAAGTLTDEARRRGKQRIYRYKYRLKAERARMRELQQFAFPTENIEESTRTHTLMRRQTAAAYLAALARRHPWEILVQQLLKHDLELTRGPRGDHDVLRSRAPLRVITPNRFWPQTRCPDFPASSDPDFSARCLADQKTSTDYYGLDYRPRVSSPDPETPQPAGPDGPKPGYELYNVFVNMRVGADVTGTIEMTRSIMASGIWMKPPAEEQHKEGGMSGEV